MVKDKEIYRVKVTDITPQDISAKDILGEYLISKDYA